MWLSALSLKVCVPEMLANLLLCEPVTGQLKTVKAGTYCLCMLRAWRQDWWVKTVNPV